MPLLVLNFLMLQCRPERLQPSIVVMQDNNAAAIRHCRFDDSNTTLCTFDFTFWFLSRVESLEKDGNHWPIHNGQSMTLASVSLIPHHWSYLYNHQISFRFKTAVMSCYSDGTKNFRSSWLQYQPFLTDNGSEEYSIGKQSHKQYDERSTYKLLYL